MVAGDLDVARFQRHAAERILDDEAWRDGLEDQVSEVLLNGVLGLVDAAIAGAAAAASAGPAAPPTDVAAASESLDDLAYEAADQARTLLQALAGHWKGLSADDALRAAEPALGQPLFTSPVEGRERLAALMAGAAPVAASADSHPPEASHQKPKRESPERPRRESHEVDDVGDRPQDRSP